MLGRFPGEILVGSGQPAKIHRQILAKLKKLLTSSFLHFLNNGNYMECLSKKLSQYEIWLPW
jgi:hypothetical protein